MTELEKMMSGQVFDGMDKEIDAIRTQATLALRASITTLTKVSATNCKTAVWQRGSLHCSSPFPLRIR